jgi:hypothetical protein
MGLWRRIEEKLWTGPVVKDYGAISEGRYGIGSRRVSVLRTRRGDAEKIVIRTSYKAFLSASVQFLDLDLEAAARLRAALDDALAPSS